MSIYQTIYYRLFFVTISFFHCAQLKVHDMQQIVIAYIYVQNFP